MDSNSNPRVTGFTHVIWYVFENLVTGSRWDEWNDHQEHI